MAKAALNKSQAIRDLLKSNKGKSPMEIAAMFKTQHGVTIPAQYVSTIKSNMKAKKGAKKLAKRAGAGSGADNGHAMMAAAQLIVHAGSMESARAILEQVGKVREMMRG